jgi:hypothetical protein
LEAFFVPPSIESLGESCFSGCRRLHLLTFDQRSALCFRLADIAIRRIYPVEYMGQVELYHATHGSAAWNIVKSQNMMRGWQGNFGGGIYFAATADIARQRAVNSRTVLKATVNLDIVLIVEGAVNDFRPECLKKIGCGGLKGMPAPGMPWEFVVYESWRVTDIKKL